ncbi:hypothetical protein ACT8ZR_29050 [Neobacillus sp. M.A.Huq-85]
MKFSFELNLPFALPFKDGQKHAAAYPNGDFLLEYNSYTRTTIRDEENFLDEKECTAVLIDFMPNEEMTKGLKKDELLKMTVTNSIHFMNLIFDALRINHGLSHIYNITIADLPLIITIQINDDKGYGYITNPQDVLMTSPVLTENELRKFGGMIQLWDTHPEVFLVEKFYASARSHLYKEEMIEAVINLQTSFEILIRNTHKLLLSHNSATQDQLEKAASIPFRNVVEDHIGRTLGVDLNFNTTTTPIKDWYEKLYVVRNEIVHKGRTSVTGNEGYAAHDAYVNARNYLGDLLKNAGILNANGNIDLNQFPKNTKGTLDGEELLKRLKERGLITEDLNQFNSEEK